MASTMFDESPLQVGEGIFGGSPLDDGDDTLLSSAPSPSSAPTIGTQAFAPAPSAPASAAAPSFQPHSFVPQAGPVPGPFSVVRPLGDDGSASTNVGRALMLVTVGAVAGYTQLGAKGIAVGGLWGAAASNAWSAFRAQQGERTTAATWAVIEAAAAGYFTWDSIKKERA